LAGAKRLKKDRPNGKAPAGKCPSKESELRPGLCYSDVFAGCAGMVHIGRKLTIGGEVSLCNRPVFLFTGFSSNATYCPECEAVHGGPVLVRQTLF
jgi:hypothetical protein